MEKQIPDYQEKTTHGSALLPVEYYYCRILESYRNLELHWHEEAEITYIENGSANYTIHFTPFRVQAGDLLFISPHVLHGASEEPGCTMASQSLVFHLNYPGGLTPDICTVKYLNPLLTGKHRFVPVIHPDQPGYPELKKCFLDLCHIFQKKESAYELQTKALLLTLLADLYRLGYIEKADLNSSSRHTEEKLKGILGYIQEHYRDPLTIQELSKVCHFSETYFMNFFRRYTGMTCVEYINRFRLTKAAAALEETDLSVTEIALDNGFHNISYFNKLFRRRFGCTPGEHRKSAKSGI
ncbi:MAG: AraC family transcriptional regulator [Lachnospiraceae bacterium]|nr:AraC family transcriptional regulator [Lachnospiraceae bacterium]